MAMGTARVIKSPFKNFKNPIKGLIEKSALFIFEKSPKLAPYALKILPPSKL
jgi:hypothetical protein